MLVTPVVLATAVVGLAFSTAAQLAFLAMLFIAVLVTESTAEDLNRAAA